MKQKQWKYVAIFLCSLVVALFATKTQARADSGDGWGSFGDNITWNYYSSTGALEIKGTGEMPEVEYYWEFPWDSYKEDVKSVVIGEGILSLSDLAFYEYDITSVKLPSTMRSLGNHSFESCHNLEGIVLPNGLTTLGYNCFYNSGLKSIDIPGTVEEIPPYCFNYCKNMERVTFHEGTKVIENSAFECTALKEVKFPSSVYKLGRHAFSNVRSIEHLVLSPSITEVGTYVFSSCEGLRTLEVDITGEIPEGMFLHCGALEMVKIGDQVTGITGNGNYLYGAFGYGGCNRCYYIPKSVMEIEKESFYTPDTDIKDIRQTFYTYTGSVAWDYAGTHSYIDFKDLDDPSNVAEWNAKWAEAMKPKKENTEDNAGNTTGGNTAGGNASGNSTVQKNPTATPSLKTITTFAVTAKKGSKYIKVKTLKDCKIVVSMNKKIMKSGKKKVKKYTIKKSKTTNKINLSKKLPKNTKITVTVSKSGYATRNRMLVVK